VDDPPLWRAVWLSRLESYSSMAEMRGRDLRQEAELAHILSRTKQRLLRLAAAFEQQVEMIDALFEPLQADADLLPALAIPAGQQADAPAAILELYENFFRDWVWGERECNQALDLVKGALTEEAQSVAVYGAGGRLAVDFHEQCLPAETFALHPNPLPFLALDKMLAGEPIKLLELPPEPISEQEVVIERTLSRRLPVRDGMHLFFADPLRPPFAAGSMDLVVTTWFVDTARTDLRQTAAAINRVLRPGGLWINLGPFRFHAVLSRAYTIEEALDIVQASEFEVLLSDRHEMAYFDSPVSGSHRTESVFRFSARKRGEATAVEIPDPFPVWVTNPTLPIPVTPALIALGRSSMFTNGVLSMIDGTRSIVDIARALGTAWRIDPARVQDELRSFLAKLPNG
jgi:hypothetical protein